MEEKGQHIAPKEARQLVSCVSTGNTVLHNSAGIYVARVTVTAAHGDRPQHLPGPFLFLPQHHCCRLEKLRHGTGKELNQRQWKSLHTVKPRSLLIPGDSNTENKVIIQSNWFLQKWEKCSKGNQRQRMGWGWGEDWEMGELFFFCCLNKMENK